MGRRHRRFSTRVGAAAAALAAGAFAYHRWKLRAGSASLRVPAEDPAWAALTPAERRASHFAALTCCAPLITGNAVPSSATVEDANGVHRSTKDSGNDSRCFDMLVVGGGLTGLYAAVDAAQRGLRVALVEAGDIGGGATGTQPLLMPGAFPFVQRAIRQRDSRWLSRAYAILDSATVWQNTAPHCLRLPASPARVTTTASPHVWTLTPALHAAEQLELAVAALVSTVLSVFSGPLRPCAPIAPLAPLPLSVRAAAAADSPVLLATDAGTVGSSASGRDCDGDGATDANGPRNSRSARGGVVTCDFTLDSAVAALSLARTAEALGVTLLTYTPLCGLHYEQSEPSASPIIVATVRDDGGGMSSSHRRNESQHLQQHRYIRFRTRGVVNCAGAWADEVRALTPNSQHDAVGPVFDRHHVYSYLVAPRDAVYWRESTAAISNSSDVSASAVQSPAHRLIPRFSQEYQAPLAHALQLASTRNSFSCMLVTPWYDGTVLLGPSITPLRSLSAAAGFVQSADGYAAQRAHIESAFASSGVGVDSRRVLSCVSTIVPLLRGPQEVPWLGDLWVKGHHIHTSTAATATSTDSGAQQNGRGSDRVQPPLPSSATTGASSSRNEARVLAPPFVHVYGGVGLTSRAVAAEAVDTFIHGTSALPAAYKAANQRSLAHTSTRWLRLVDPAEGSISDNSLSTHAADGDSNAPTTTSAAAAALDVVLSRGYVAHLADVFTRRLHVGYTSPSEAVAALPAVAALTARKLGWDASRTEEEIRATERLIRGIVVAPPVAR